jgi:hypothetical protein
MVTVILLLAMQPFLPVQATAQQGGNAFLSRQKDVLDKIQMLRRKTQVIIF